MYVSVSYDRNCSGISYDICFHSLCQSTAVYANYVFWRVSMSSEEVQFILFFLFEHITGVACMNELHVRCAASGMLYVLVY